MLPTTEKVLRILRFIIRESLKFKSALFFVNFKKKEKEERNFKKKTGVYTILNFLIC